MVLRRMRRIAGAGLLGTALVLVSACGSSSPGGQALEGAVATPPLVVRDQQLPEGENGTPFTFQAPPGELLAVYFGYTQCPDLCPTTMADLKVAIANVDKGAERVSVAMVTVDPDRDSAQVLTSYLSHFFGDAAHPLRTTDSEALKAVEAAFLATSNVKRTNSGVQVEHTATTSIVDDQGVVVVQWPFGTSPTSMAHDLRILLAESKADA